MENTVKTIFEEYRTGNNFKNSIGPKGIREQTIINERFYVGDQWHGAKCGNERPLVRHNIIKRIGEYKMAIVSAAPITVAYSADGVPNTINSNEKLEKMRDEQAGIAQDIEAQPDAVMSDTAEIDEINSVMSALSDYFNVTAERVKFNELKEQALRNAYISGTGIIYTYWDGNVRTGLYADEGKQTAIKGDIRCEILDVENVTFGDPNQDDVQEQPYIIIAQRKSVAELKREAKRNRRPKDEINSIKSDNDYSGMSGQRAETEPENSKKAVVLTKLWKDYNEDGTDYTIKAIRVTENAIIRNEWDLGLSNYPIAKMSWERRRSSIYGDSEITYLIPNQIAINRTLTSQVWAGIVYGMPIMVKDADVITGPVTNMPGQIIDVNCGGQGVGGAIDYLTPPAFNGQLDNLIQSLINITMSQAGANDAALGNMRPDNMSAIVAIREAATMPMQAIQNRFYQMCEDIARIWADFWVNMYGSRQLKIVDRRGTWYLPFDAEKYKDLMISVKVDVGAATLWGEAQVISTLDNLLAAGIITAQQYFDRLPKGLIPDITGLKRDLNEAANAIPPTAPTDTQTANNQTPNINNILASLTEEERVAFEALPPEEQQAMLNNALGGAGV